MTAVRVCCPRCARAWEIPARSDATFPATARCAVSRGGCGHTVKVPRPRSGARLSPGPDIPAWSPPSEPRRPRAADEECARCGAALIASPRGTLRVCTARGRCGGRVAPRGVLAPYARGQAAARQVKSQREIDLEALDLAGRKGIMLGQLSALIESGRLDDPSRMKTEWFCEQVKAATTGARLDEMAVLWDDAGIRPRRWWQPRPAAITAGWAEDDDEDDYADDDGQDDEPAAELRAPASIPAQQSRPTTWDEALNAAGWRLSPAVGGCQVIDQTGWCGDPDSPNHVADNAWACHRHYAALTGTIARMNRAKGVA